MDINIKTPNGVNIQVQENLSKLNITIEEGKTSASDVFNTDIIIKHGAVGEIVLNLGELIEKVLIDRFTTKKQDEKES
jgi:hypothetical protein